ncbi:MAG: hypothetical protein JNJ90_04690 [Saprospiraceae bacterium]|nr:hypothetical protein [Saprospiraceae bacterium]
MNVILEDRKLSIVEHLAQINDESVILQIEALLKPSVDFWDELTEAQKAHILNGLEQLSAGKKVKYQKTIARFKKNRNAL